jgi:hypothetical protein
MVEGLHWRPPLEAVRVMAADPRIEVETRNGKGETPIMWAVKQCGNGHLHV